MALDPRLRYPREKALFAIGVTFSAVVWVALLVSIAGAIYGLVILGVVLGAHALLLARVRGNGVRISDKQLPALYERCHAAASRLHVEPMPEVYLIQSGGAPGALATRLLSRHVIILHSALVDACPEPADDPGPLDFVIAHEMAHLAAGHLAWKGFLLPMQLVPLLGTAYSRACEYTCDRYGLELVGRLEAAQRGLAIVAAGGKQARALDLDAFVEQRLESGRFWMAVAELLSSRPYLCKRAGALREQAMPGTMRPVSRNVLAYPLAPLFAVSAVGSAAGSAIVVVALLAALVSVGAPAITRYFERIKAEAATHEAAPPQDEGSEPVRDPLDRSAIDPGK